MIPRYQRVLFFVLLALSVTMAIVLVRLRERAHDRLLVGVDSAPTKAPTVAPAEQATLLVANDQDGTLISEIQSLPLPADPEARSRAILNQLLAIYSSAGSPHPVPNGASAVSQVFLLPLPSANPSPGGLAGAPPGLLPSPAKAGARTSPASLQPGPLLAVVNLKGGYADGHPSGILAETLTVLSICGTLRANLPAIAQVRFLVNGEMRPTLAGHADLTRAYLTTDAATPTVGPTSQP